MQTICYLFLAIFTTPHIAVAGTLILLPVSANQADLAALLGGGVVLISPDSTFALDDFQADGLSVSALSDLMLCVCLTACRSFRTFSSFVVGR